MAAADASPSEVETGDTEERKKKWRGAGRRAEGAKGGGKSKEVNQGQK